MKPDRQSDDDAVIASERRAMVQTVRAHARLTAAEGVDTVLDERVLRAMAKVPRHEFVPYESRHRAYQDLPLPIGFGQTISQPFIVACMSSLLGLQPGQRVLEVGSGSGYQAAVLADLGAQVFGMELVPELARQAQSRLRALGYAARIRCGDGSAGWPDEAPFDGILVTAAASIVPRALVEQLAPNARLVMPVGPQFGAQWLTVVERDEQQQVRQRVLFEVRFVPLHVGAGSGW